MNLVLEIEDPQSEIEVARLLRVAAVCIAEQQCHGQLIDLSGRAVGGWYFASDEVTPVKVGRHGG